MAHYFYYYYYYALFWIVFSTCSSGSMVSCQNINRNDAEIVSTSTSPDFSNAICPGKSKNIDNANNAKDANTCLPPSFEDFGPGRQSGNEYDFETFKNAFQKMIRKQSSSNLTEFREWSIRKGREFLEEEMAMMANVPFHDKSKKLEDFILEKGGKPIRNIILSTWRSGSTFLTGILESHPGTYIHFEPLIPLGLIQVRSGGSAEHAVRDIRELLNCRYGNSSKLVITSYKVINTENLRLGQFCTRKPGVCQDASFLSRMCGLFPIQSMKTVRMRLTPAIPLLDDADLDIRLLILVRDPRGTMQSRQHCTRCKARPDCGSSQILCSDMEADFHAATMLRKKYPGRFMVLRYEDLSLNPYSTVKKLFKFFRLQYHSNVERFLDTHTTQYKKGHLSTYRDSKTTPFHWREKFLDNFDEVKRIQSHCKRAMAMWGYRLAKDKSDMMAYNPVDKPPWEDMIIPENDTR